MSSEMRCTSAAPGCGSDALPSSRLRQVLSGKAEGRAHARRPPLASELARAGGDSAVPAAVHRQPAGEPAGSGGQYWKGNFVKELTDEAIAAHVQHGPNAPNVSSTMHLYPINGACQRVAPDATAFGHRDANFSMVIFAASEDPADDEANTKWVRDYSDALVLVVAGEVKYGRVNVVEPSVSRRRFSIR